MSHAWHGSIKRARAQELFERMGDPMLQKRLAFFNDTVVAADEYDRTAGKLRVYNGESQQGSK